jgi:glycosyl transferase family 87
MAVLGHELRNVRRVIPYAAGVGLAAGLLVLAGLPAMHGPVNSTDLAYIWAGPRTLLDGANPYDASSWSASVARLETPEAASDIYTYPPYVLMALAPIGLLPLQLLDGIWLWGSVIAGVIAMGALLQAFLPRMRLAHGLVGFALLGTQSAAQDIYNVQWAFWLLAALCLAVLALGDGRSTRGAVATSALLLKPQLFLLTLPALFLHAEPRVRRRFVGLVLAVATIWIGASVLAAPGWWSSWISAVALTRGAEPNIGTLTTAANDAFGPAGRVGVVLLVAAAAALVLVRSGSSSLAWPATAIALSLTAAPYARSYDQPLLLVSVVLAAAALVRVGDRRGARRVILIGALGLVVLSWGVLSFVAGPLSSEAPFGLVSAYVALLSVIAAPKRPARASAPVTSAVAPSPPA